MRESGWTFDIVHYKGRDQVRFRVMTAEEAAVWGEVRKNAKLTLDSEKDTPYNIK